jgi:hypothetical protein
MPLNSSGEMRVYAPPSTSPLDPELFDPGRCVVFLGAARFRRVRASAGGEHRCRKKRSEEERSFEMFHEISLFDPYKG